MQDLLIKTEISAERIVESVVSIIKTCFGERILSIYLSGSFNRNQLTLSSDIDMTIIFCGRMSDAEYARFMQLREGLQPLSPLRLDMGAESENKIKARPANVAMRSANCLYGEDFFHALSPQPIEHYAMRWIHKSIHYMSVLRGRPQPNPIPLTYPQTDDDYSGYTQFADFDGAEAFTKGIRIIVNMITACSSARLAIDSGIEVTTKQDSITQYREHIADEWSDYIIQIVHLIKIDLQYRFPSQSDEQERLKTVLEKLPDFENAMLEHFRPVIVENLQSDDRRRRKLALVALKNVQFHDESIASALSAISDSDDMELLQTVKSLNL